jgi:hypothetical protein
MRRLVQEAKYDVICDTCGRALESQIKSDGIKLIIVDTEYDFCSMKCLVSFLYAEITKEK